MGAEKRLDQTVVLLNKIKSYKELIALNEGSAEKLATVIHDRYVSELEKHTGINFTEGAFPMSLSDFAGSYGVDLKTIN